MTYRNNVSTVFEKHYNKIFCFVLMKTINLLTQMTYFKSQKKKFIANHFNSKQIWTEKQIS